jgi:serine/threonine protein kinase
MPQCQCLDLTFQQNALQETRAVKLLISLSYKHLLKVFYTASLLVLTVKQFYGICIEPPHISLVFEYCANGNLREYMEKNHLSWSQRVAIAIGISKGMLCLHKHGCVHRDIKVDNVVITASGVAKLADFGSLRYIFQAADERIDISMSTIPFKRHSTFQVRSNSRLTTREGTLIYNPPELLNAKTSHVSVDKPFAIDYWSLGITLLELFNSKHYLDNLMHSSTDHIFAHQILTELERGALENALAQLDNANLVDLIRTLCAPIPDHRLAAAIVPTLKALERETGYPPVAQTMEQEKKNCNLM